MPLLRVHLAPHIEKDVGFLLGNDRLGARPHRAVVEVEPVAVAQRERRIVTAT